MNTNKLKSFAQIARRILMEGVSRRITYYGFDAKGKVIDEPIPVPGGVIIREEIIDDATVPAKWQALRAAIQRHGVEAVIEEAAYTWFNRLMAMQILAKNNYDPTQLEYESAGSVTPVILARARRGMISYLDRTEQKRVQPLLGDYQNEQKAFAILLTGYCHHHQLLNRIFGRLDDYTELLLPDNILAESGLIYLLNTTDAITNEDYGQVELIGWLYQFYISEKKDQVFASFKKNQKAEAEDIPAATQIFTPNWIVKYMVQNTVGRIWLDHRPESPLRQKMKYLVESPDEPSAERSFLPPTGGLEGSFKLLDPACGSGHILVEGFFHLYDIYEEEYYMPAEAVEKILQHNLFGLDIDLRAAQLAQFAVLLAAATKYPDILKKEIAPHIYAMPEFAVFSREEILDFLGSEGTQHVKVLTRALDLMQQSKNLGSVMQFNVTPTEQQFFIQRLETLQTDAKTSLLIQSLLNKIQPFLQVLFILTDHFEAVIANPPYMGSGNFNDILKDYIAQHYTQSKSDLFAVFMEICMNVCQPAARMGMINMHNWMFLSSFEALRKTIIEKYHIDNMLHLGPRTFDELSGEVVQNTAFILQNCISNKSSVYYRLVDAPNCTAKETMFKNNENKYDNISQANFEKIPGSPIAYWVSKNSVNAFVNGKRITDYVDTFQGIITGNNEKFLRFWVEVNSEKIPFHATDIKKVNLNSQFWIPYNKGGDCRKWYGIQDYVVFWKFGPDDKTRGKKGFEKYYLNEYVAWSYTVSNSIATRYYPAGFLWDVRGSGIMDNTNNLYYLQGLISSKIGIYFFKINNSTLSCQVENIIQLPIIINEQIKPHVDELVKQNISISRTDWDSSEISWDFLQHPLIANKNGSLEKAYHQWKTKATQDFFQLHAHETELNRIFINIYGLKDELTPEVKLKEITILQDELDSNIMGEASEAIDNLPINANVVMSQLISYSLGCMMGRYSLDAPGLILANQGETLEEYKAKVESQNTGDTRQEMGEFMPDDDGIVPMMGSNCGFSDDAALRLRHFIEAVWGSETLTQNINFLQSCLDMEIEKYLVNQNNFWKDHCSRYKKKPIYWLFSSKKGAFQVLVYMHRMNRFTVQKIRETYMFKHLQWLANQKADLERRSATLSRDETRQLDYYRTALNECQEYDLQLKNIADQQIEFDLDDGVSVNYAKFEPLLAGIK